MAMTGTIFDPGAVSRLPDPLPALRDLQEHDRVHWSPRYRDLALAADGVTWKKNFVLRGPTTLMLKAEDGARA